MDMTINIHQLISMIEKKIPIPQRINANLELKVLCPGPDDGDGGDIPTTTPLKIPETATLIISPLGCSLHLSETGRGIYNSGRAWILNLSESEVISGDYSAKIHLATEEILAKTPIKLQGLILCGTCIDALLNTDYDSICTQLAKRFHLRVTYQIMGPIIKGTPRNGQYHMYTAIYGLLKSTKRNPGQRSINILGKLNSPKTESDLPLLLKQAGITDLFYMGDFSSLDECDKMTNSILNIVVNEKAITSAKNMEKKFGIPYLYFSPTYNADKIHNYYTQLSALLKIRINDDIFFHHSKELSRKIQKHARSLTCAVGERNIFSTLDAALDVLNLGYQLKAIFLRKAGPSDLPLLKEIAQKSPDTLIYFDTHPALWNLINSPVNFDVSFGVPLLYLKGSPKTLDAPIHFPYIDYSSLDVLLSQMEQLLSPPIHQHTATTNLVSLKRQWNTYERSI